MTEPLLRFLHSADVLSQVTLGPFRKTATDRLVDPMSRTLRSGCVRVVAVVVAIATTVGLAAQDAPTPPVALEPIDAIVSAFTKHDVVVLGEGPHGNDGAREWRVPRLVLIRGTVIGARPMASFYQIPPSPGWSTVHMEDLYDAVLFMGDMSPTLSRLTRDQCRDSNYMKMRLGRMALDVPQARQGRIDGLKQFCAAMSSKSGVKAVLQPHAADGVPRDHAPPRLMRQR